MSDRSILDDTALVLTITYAERVPLLIALRARIRIFAERITESRIDCYRDTYWQDLITLVGVLVRLYPGTDEEWTDTARVLDGFPALDGYRRRPDCPVQLSLPPTVQLQAAE
jgi:hypothetical protein